MKKILTFGLILCLLTGLVFPVSSCGSGAPKTYTFFVMDTVLTFSLYGADTAAFAREAADIATAIEKEASATLAESQVSRFNEAEESFAFSDGMTEILMGALAMSAASGGAYDITVAPLVTLWNIKGAGPVPDRDAVAAALAHVGYDKLTLSGNILTKSDPALKIDLGSAAKGYALGKMADYLTAAGAVGVINFGGNVALVGEKPDGTPWRVSLRDPFDASAIMGTMTLTEGIVAVSGDYERYFEADGLRYHHILSPFDGAPARGVHTVAIHAANALEADMLSTALFVLGEAGAKALYDSGLYEFSYVMVTEGGKLVTSPDLDGIYHSTE